MQMVSNGDYLHEKSNPVFGEKKKKKVINLSSDELAQRVVKVNISVAIKNSVSVSS